MTTIGFIGLGNMGLPMATNLVKEGFDVSGFDLSQEALASLSESGGATASDIPQAVAEADFVVTMLPAGTHVEAVYLGDQGILATARSDTLLIDSSTIDVATARKVADEASAKGFDFLDAPVSGGVGGAQAGTLTFMVGGPEHAFNNANAVLKAMGKNIVHAGAAGDGQAAKICNNMLLAISMIGTAEAFALADKLGLDRQRLFDIASTASGQCWSLTSYCPVPGPVPASPANRDYAPGFQAALMLKDLKLAMDAAQQFGAVTPLGRASKDLYEEMAAAGQGALDFSAIFQRLSKK